MITGCMMVWRIWGNDDDRKFLVFTEEGHAMFCFAGVRLRNFGYTLIWCSGVQTNSGRSWVPHSEYHLGKHHWTEPYNGTYCILVPESRIADSTGPQYNQLANMFDPDLFALRYLLLLSSGFFPKLENQYSTVIIYVTVVHHELFVSDITIEHIHQNRLLFFQSIPWIDLGTINRSDTSLASQRFWLELSPNKFVDIGWVLMVQRWYWNSPRKIWGLHFGNILWKHFLCLRFCLAAALVPNPITTRKLKELSPKNILITSYWQKYCFRTSHETPWSTCTVFRSSYDES